MSRSELKPCVKHGSLCDNPEHWTKPTEAEHPFTRPDGSEADMFIQWKGTNVCLDFHCPCGTHSHLDTDFTYFVRCPGCGMVYEMGTQVIAKMMTPGDAREQYAKMGDTH